MVIYQRPWIEYTTMQINYLSRNRSARVARLRFLSLCFFIFFLLFLLVLSNITSSQSFSNCCCRLTLSASLDISNPSVFNVSSQETVAPALVIVSALVNCLAASASASTKKASGESAAPEPGSPKPEMACMTPLRMAASEGGEGPKRLGLNGLRKRDEGWEIRRSGRWREKNWCILKSLGLIICVGICCR